MFYKIGKYKFQLVEEIILEKDKSGFIKKFFPKDRYKNLKNIPLHKYGKGPFCSFKIPVEYKKKSGVYLLFVNNELKYVGICKDLYYRFNSGYGNISPRNCFIKGQSTNCKINSKILKEIKNLNRVYLYFFKTNKTLDLEDMIINKYDPEWNDKKIGNLNLSKSAKGGFLKVKSKYIKLKEYLKNYSISLSYEEIEKIIGEKLPKSAFVHKIWWSNSGHEHAKIWTDAGWKVEDVKLGKYITFRKIS